MSSASDRDQLQVVQKNDAISFWTLCIAIGLSAVLTTIAFGLSFYAFAYSDDRIRGIVEILAGLLSIVAFTWIIATFILQWVGLRQQSIALRQSHGQITRDIEMVQQELVRREARDSEERLFKQAGNVKYLSELLCERLIAHGQTKASGTGLPGKTGAPGSEGAAGSGRTLAELVPSDGAERLLRLHFQGAPAVGSAAATLFEAIGDLIEYEGEWSYDQDGSAVVTAIYDILSFEKLITRFLEEIAAVLVRSGAHDLGEQDLLAKLLTHDLGLAIVLRSRFPNYASNLAELDAVIWAVLGIDVEADMGYGELVDPERCRLLDERAKALGLAAIIERFANRREAARKAFATRQVPAVSTSDQNLHEPF